MSENKIVKETKLYKYNIESPTIAAEDIILSGIHLNSKLFGGEVIPTRLDTFQQILMSGKTVNSRSAEQIIGFTLDVDDSKRGDKIRSVTVKRIDTSGNATALSNEVYMYIDMIDVNNAVISTFFSDQPKQQTQNDISIGDIKQNTWTFGDEVTIPTRCVRVDFRFSTVKNERQTNCSIRTHSWYQTGNPNRLYLQGYKTIWPGNRYEPYTSQVYIDFDIIVTGLQSHSKDSTLHLSPEKDQKIASIDLLQETIDGHIDDEDRHMSVVEREQISLNTNNIALLNSNKVDYKTFENKFDELQKFFDVTPKEKIRNTKDIFFKDNNGSAARIHAWDLKTAEFVGEYLTQVTIYRPTDIAYIDSSDILHNNPQRLSVECLDEEGNLLDTYFSNDADSQKDGDDNTTTWNFDEIIIKEEYNKLRFRVTTQGGVLENQPQSMKRAILCYTYTNIPDTNDWGLIEQNNAVQAGHTMYFQFKTITKQQNFAAHVINQDIHVTLEDKERWNSIEIPEIPEIPDLSQFSDHVGDDDIHVTAEDKERWNNIVIPELPEIPEPITYTAGNGIDITDNTISVISTDVIEESDKIPTAKALYNTFYGTRTFNNYDTSKYTHLADTVGTIVLSKKHFISGGKITKVLVPHGNTQEDLNNGQGGFLVIDVFKEDNSFSEGYDKNNPTHRYWADEYYAYKNRLNEGHYEWTFNKRECIIPDDYKVVHLSLVVDEANVPNVGVTSSSNAQFRINCLAKNGNRDEGVVYEEDDECKLYWQGGTNGENRVAIVQVEYIGNKLNDYYIVPMLLERISALEARVSELENS